MNTLQLSDVQHFNLTSLLLLRDAARDDLGAACCKFGLDCAELLALRDLSPDAVLEIVTGMGNEALFCPRQDLAVLLKLPMPVSAVVACARPRFPARRTQALP